MKIYKISMLALLAAGALFLSSFIGNDDKDAGTTATQVEEGENFGYAFGVLIGSNLKTQGFTTEDVDLDELIKGLKAALSDGKTDIDANKAQQIVQDVMTKKQAVAQEKAASAGKEFLAKNGKRDGVKTTASGLQYEVMKEGAGAKPTVQDKVKVHYHGTLPDGTVFDSSVDRGEPISFALGQVIQGWQEGLQLMSIGSKYKLFIPANLGYGDRPAGKIPANSALIFEVELLGINE